MSVKFRPVALAAKYELLDELGHGSQATVYLAREKATGEHFAIKTYPKAHMTPEERKHAEDESAILTKLSHPNLLKIVEFIEDSDYIFLVTELCKGGELFERIITREEYTEKDAQVILRSLADALNYCHSMKIVHRDLKPENILLSSEEEDAIIKISDFGFATEVENNLKSRVGTYAYCAPEILSNKPYDSSVDVWSFGVIMYVLLSGSLPFFSENEAVMVKSIIEGEVSLSSPQWDKVSEEAKNLILSCLKTDPKKRLTAAEILAHPWIVNELSVQDITPAINDLKKLLLRRQFKRTALSIIMANRLKSITAKMAAT